MTLRNIRNFWLTADVDGRQERIATGPRGADGGMDIELMVRDKDGDGNAFVATALEVMCRNVNGNLVITVRDAEGNLVYQTFGER